MRIRDNFKSILLLYDIIAAIAVALLLYYIAYYVVIDKFQIMPVSWGRIVEIKKFLDSKISSESHKNIFIFGSSTTIEGLDCNRLDEFLPENFASYNLAWTGGSPHQLLLILPAVNAAKPYMAVLCVDYWSLFEDSRIPSELLNIVGWWQFIPQSELEYFSSNFNKEEFDELKESRFLHLWQMRSFLPETLEAYVREFSRPDLRYDGYRTNFKAPWVRTKVVSPTAMEKDIEKFRRLATSLKTDDMQRGIDALGSIVSYVSQNGIKVTIVLSPFNPKAAESIDKNTMNCAIEAVSELAKKHSAIFINQFALLSPDQFADGAHAFEPGRIIWTEALGQAISKECKTQE
jgi:hypothetical protein